MDYSKVNKDELIFIVKAAYEYKDAALAEHYFNQVIAKNAFIDSIKDEISLLPTHKRVNAEREQYNVITENEYKKSVLNTIINRQIMVGDSPYLSKHSKMTILNYLHSYIDEAGKSYENDPVDPFSATGFRKWYVLPSFDRARDCPVLQSIHKDIDETLKNNLVEGSEKLKEATDSVSSSNRKKSFR
ncbi:hypothetical protein OGM23_04025 [Dickeya fangzhongdai]|uniref:hypothetical protein n=1 Tax=Dickeya fangzhongdai TaxID=1778540 RepID=UPI002B27E3C3|nr:hypothetical protein OGM23_04025 [Dickeya fangzhongdai]